MKLTEKWAHTCAHTRIPVNCPQTDTTGEPHKAEDLSYTMVLYGVSLDQVQLRHALLKHSGGPQHLPL